MTQGCFQVKRFYKATLERSIKLFINSTLLLCTFSWVPVTFVPTFDYWMKLSSDKDEALPWTVPEPQKWYLQKYLFNGRSCRNYLTHE